MKRTKTMLATVLTFTYLMSACGIEAEISTTESVPDIAETTQQTEILQSLETGEQTESNIPEETTFWDELQENQKNTMCLEVPPTEKKNSGLHDIGAEHPDFSFEESEAEEVKTIALDMLSAFQTQDINNILEHLVQKTDIDLLYYACYGELKSQQELKEFFSDENNIDFSMLIFPDTIQYTVTDVKITEADDDFWYYISKDSPILEDISAYGYDASECFSIDKCYQVIIDANDDIHPSNNETAVRIYIARVNGEWKFECMFNFMYESYAITQTAHEQMEEKPTIAELE